MYCYSDPGGVLTKVALAGKRPAARNFLCSCKESHQRKHALHPSKPHDFGTRLGGERTRFAQTPFADTPQPRPKITAPGEGGCKPAYCSPVSHPTLGYRSGGFQHPLLRRRFFRRRAGEVGEHCLSPKGESRSRPSGVGKIGHPKGGEAGCAFFRTFLCTSKERYWPQGHSRPTLVDYIEIGC